MTTIADQIRRIAKLHGDHELASGAAYPVSTVSPMGSAPGVEVWCSPARTDDGESLLPGVLRIAVVDGGGRTVSAYDVSPHGELHHRRGERLL